MHVRLQQITKRYGPVLANDGATLDITPGRTLALLGENGAGKSTLMRILYGMTRPDAGSILVDGAEVRLDSPRAARAAGIGMVFQRFSAIPALTVRENLPLAAPGTPWWIGRGARRVSAALDTLRGLAPDLDPEARVSDLAAGQIQLVELAKVLRPETRLLILDEPTSVLSDAEAQRLWQLTRDIAGRGVGIVFITHKIADVEACADAVAVMRRGRVVETLPVGARPARALLDLVVGETVVPSVASPPPEPAAVPRVRVCGVRATDGAETVDAVDLELARGEVLGIAGVAGNGQELLAAACAGVTPLLAGEVVVDGVTAFAPRLERARGPGVAYIPAQPIRNAVAPDLPLAVNLWLRRFATLPRWLDRGAMTAWARERLEAFDVRPPRPELPAGALSGGNLQKLVAARELDGAPALVVACYPTMGLDVAATAAIYGTLFELARRGSAVLWISEDLDDLLRYAHRVAVMFRGRIAGQCEARPEHRSRIGAWMTGAEATA